MANKAKKMAKQSPSFKAELESFEERLLSAAAERKEEEATTQVLIPSCNKLIVPCIDEG